MIIMHFLHLIIFTHTHTHTHIYIYIFTFPIFTVTAGLIMTVLMTLFININSWILLYYNLTYVLFNTFTLMIWWQFLYRMVLSD